MSFHVRLAIILALSFPVLAAGCDVPQEWQGWQSEDSHLHVSTTGAEKLMLGRLTEAKTVDLKILFHNNPGTLTWFGWQDGSNTKQTVTVPGGWTPGGDQSEAVYPGESAGLPKPQLTIDPAKFDASGCRELRIRVNRGEPEREFTTTRIPVWVENGKLIDNYACEGSPDTGPTSAGRCGGGAWYPAPTEYRVVFVDCRDVWRAGRAHTHPGDVFRVKGQDGPLTVTLDPKFHSGDKGRELLVAGSANTWHQVRVPDDITPGVHRLHMRATSSNGEAGVYVLTFLVPEPE